MSSINNLQGTIIKDGKVVYSEKLQDELYFAVILMYEPFYAGKNTAGNQESSKLMCQAVITNGKKHTWSNGITSLEEAMVVEIIEGDNVFAALKNELKTKDGFRVWQKDYGYLEREYIIQEKKIKLKMRKVKWLVEVPKINLLEYCKMN